MDGFVIVDQLGNDATKFVHFSSHMLPSIIVLEAPRPQNKWVKENESQLRIRLSACIQNKAIVILPLFQVDTLFPAATNVVHAYENTENVGFHIDSVLLPPSLEIPNRVPAHTTVEKLETSLGHIHSQS